MSDLLSSGRHSQETFAQDGRVVEDGFLTIDISAQISQAINEEGEQVVLQPETLTASQLIAVPKIFNAGFLSRMAVAAAVVLSVLLVFKPFDSRVAVNVDSQVAAVAPPVDESLYSDLSVAVVEKPFTPEHARRLNEYLLRHAENSVTGGRSGLMPLARVASFTNADN